MVTYKIDIIDRLKDAGYNSTRIRREGILSQSVLQRIREGASPSIDTVNKLCKLLGCQPGQLLEYTPDIEKESEN